MAVEVNIKTNFAKFNKEIKENAQFISRLDKRYSVLEKTYQRLVGRQKRLIDGFDKFNHRLTIGGNTISKYDKNVNKTQKSFTKWRTSIINAHKAMRTLHATPTNLNKLTKQVTRYRDAQERATASVLKHRRAIVRTRLSHDLFSDTLRKVRFMLLGVVASLATTRVLQFADSTQRIENRLRLSLKPGQKLEDLMGKIGHVAKRSRQPLEATAVAFFRIQQAASKLGLTQDQVIKGTELFNKRLTIQGATAHEARSALLQFSQSLQAGRLSGDEFRSISEILPSILDDLAKATGRSRKQLKDLAAQGRLTPRIMLKALFDNAKRTEELFETTNVTIAQGFNIVATSATLTFAEMMKQDHVAKAIKNSFIALADVIDSLIKGLDVAIKALVIVFDNLNIILAVTIIRFRTLVKMKLLRLFTALTAATGGLTKAFRIFNLVLKKNPLILAASLLIAFPGILKKAAQAMGFFKEEVDKTNDSLNDMPIPDLIQALSEQFGEAFLDQFQKFTLQLGDAAKELGKQVSDALTTAFEEVGRAIVGVIRYGEDFKRSFMDIALALERALYEALANIAVRAVLDMIIEKLKEIFGNKEKEEDKTLNRTKKLTDEYDKMVGLARDIERHMMGAASANPMAGFGVKGQQQGPMTKEQYDKVKRGLGSTLFGPLGNILTPSANASDIVSGASPFNFGGGGSVSGTAITAGMASFGVPPAFSQPLADMFGSKIDGLGKDLLGGIVPELKNGPGKIIGKLGSVQSVLSGDLSGLGSIFTGGFSNLSGIMGGLSGILGGGGIGGIFKKGKKLLGFADGGRPPLGVASLVGEEGPELFVPDTPGTIVPNGGMGGTVVIQKLEIMPGANVDQALVDKPMTFWVDLAQEKILPALNTLGQAGNTTTLNFRGNR